MRTPSINTDTYANKNSNIAYGLRIDTSPRLGLRLGVLGIAAAGALSAGCGKIPDDLFCGKMGCAWSDEDWARIAALSNLPEAPPEDLSNKYTTTAAAQALGQKWFYDGRFSGNASAVDQLRRPVPYARAAKGQPLGISCVTCHDPNRGGIDDTSIPGHVSVGSGWFDVNAQPTLNSGFYDLVFWNGRADSLWAQAIAAMEGGVSMNGNRLHVAWVIADLYRTDYQQVFAEYPLPMPAASSTVQAIVQPDGARAGQCLLVAGACPAEQGCREVVDAVGGAPGCWPHIPLNGKPGSKAGCQPNDATEPFNDAWDCMAKEDQDAAGRILVNFGKAIAAYESLLVSRNSAFDRFVQDGHDSTAISPAAQRGARLFVGRAACSDCHNTPLLSDDKFHNIGAPQTGPAVPTEADCPMGGVCDCVEVPAGTAADGTDIPRRDAKNCLPWGARDGLLKLQANKFRRDSAWSDTPTDTSRMGYVTQSPDDVPRGTWRTPTLRDVSLTAPYMHDGCFSTLEEVIDHYDRGGGATNAVGDPAPQLRPLYLSARDKSDLIEFLKTLTGEPLPMALRTAPVLP
jgi:cytochrome c peroxidase